MDYLTEYNSDWPDWFLHIRAYLLPFVTSCLRIEHVGSTSIPGMAAKPIIDIDIVVKDGATLEAIASVEQAGYVHQGNLGIVGREAFQSILDAARMLPPHHLYACEESSPELRKHVSFREYLMAHPSEAARLSDFKRLLAFERRLTRSEYIEAKSPMVGEISAKALMWYERRGPEKRI